MWIRCKSRHYGVVDVHADINVALVETLVGFAALYHQMRQYSASSVASFDISTHSTQLACINKSESKICNDIPKTVGSSKRHDDQLAHIVDGDKSTDVGDDIGTIVARSESVSTYSLYLALNCDGVLTREIHTRC